jgi:8-oxo-dGTP diphosphatase
VGTYPTTIDIDPPSQGSTEQLHAVVRPTGRDATGSAAAAFAYILGMASHDGDPSRAVTDSEVPTANAWVDCDCGQRHWGRYGAAGLLLVWRPEAGGGPDGSEVLLQLRAGWTHLGGTWALPGGARGHDESVEQAALREAAEEAGLDPTGIQLDGVVVVDHGPWSYTYVLAETDRKPTVSPSDEETQDLAWVPLEAVADYPLHPLFAEAWPDLLSRVREPVRRS